MRRQDEIVGKKAKAVAEDFLAGKIPATERPSYEFLQNVEALRRETVKKLEASVSDLLTSSWDTAYAKQKAEMERHIAYYADAFVKLVSGRSKERDRYGDPNPLVFHEEAQRIITEKFIHLYPPLKREIERYSSIYDRIPSRQVLCGWDPNLAILIHAYQCLERLHLGIGRTPATA